MLPREICRRTYQSSRVLKLDATLLIHEAAGFGVEVQIPSTSLRNRMCGKGFVERSP